MSFLQFLSVEERILDLEGCFSFASLWVERSNKIDAILRETMLNVDDEIGNV